MLFVYPGLWSRNLTEDPALPGRCLLVVVYLLSSLPIHRSTANQLRSSSFVLRHPRRFLRRSNSRSPTGAPGYPLSYILSAPLPISVPTLWPLSSLIPSCGCIKHRATGRNCLTPLRSQLRHPSISVLFCLLFFFLLASSPS